jgi:hypothetical protein
MTRSGIAVSDDRVHWHHHAWATPPDMDDRDVILFPEKVNGRFALLRRPLQWVGPNYGTDHPGIWLTFSDNLETLGPADPDRPARVRLGRHRIGGSTPPSRRRGLARFLPRRRKRWTRHQAGLLPCERASLLDSNARARFIAAPEPMHGAEILLRTPSVLCTSRIVHFPSTQP